jgi:hypothetical protein
MVFCFGNPKHLHTKSKRGLPSSRYPYKGFFAMAILQGGLLLSKREGSLDALALVLAMALVVLCVFRVLLMTRNTSFYS